MLGWKALTKAELIGKVTAMVSHDRTLTGDRTPSGPKQNCMRTEWSWMAWLGPAEVPKDKPFLVLRGFWVGRRVPHLGSPAYVPESPRRKPLDRSKDRIQSAGSRFWGVRLWAPRCEGGRDCRARAGFLIYSVWKRWGGEG